MKCDRREYQKVGWGVHGAGVSCGCHEKDTVNYTAEQIKEMIKNMETVGDNLVFLDLKNYKQNDTIPRYPHSLRFCYGGETVEVIPYLYDGVKGTLVFVDVLYNNNEIELLYNIVGRTITNVWNRQTAPNWTKYWITKTQVETLDEVVDSLILEK